MKLGVYAMGCKVNTFEVQAIARLAQEKGHTLVNRNADIFLMNTCTVTAVSDHKNLRALHKIRKENPHAKIAAFGCLAQVDAEKLKQSGEVDAVFGTSSRDQVLLLCEQLHQDALDQQLVARTFAAESQLAFLPAGVPAGRTRALLKVVDGCNNYCSYCIIPTTRGRVRSLPLSQAVAECQRLAQEGVKEIILTGIEISSYGMDCSSTLVALVSAICAAVPTVSIRLGSLEPRTVDAAFCSTLSQYPNLIPHFHVALQSGCDTILADMRRRYSTTYYAQMVVLLRHFFPNCAITTDLIVGFPGETDAQFAESLAFAQSCAFAGMHIFPYSLRAGTVAATMDEQIPQSVKEQRANRARLLAEELSLQYRAQWKGQTVRVLMEHPTMEGYWSGHTVTNFPVYACQQGISLPSLKNKHCLVHLTGYYKEGMLGELLEVEQPAPLR